MNRARLLIALGSVLLLIGLLATFLSDRYTTQIQGKRRMGVIVFGPTEGSPEWKKTEVLLAWADRSFYAGLVLTAVGLILQTWGSLLALSLSSPGVDSAVDSKGAIPDSRNEVAAVPSVDATQRMEKPMEASEGGKTPLRQQIESLIRAAGVGPEGKERLFQELNAFTQWELNQRLRELTLEVLRLTCAQDMGSREQARWARALVIWTKVLVFVTAAYVLFTGGLLWLAWKN